MPTSKGGFIGVSTNTSKKNVKYESLAHVAEHAPEALTEFVNGLRGEVARLDAHANHLAHKFVLTTSSEVQAEALMVLGARDALSEVIESVNKLRGTTDGNKPT